MHENEKKLAIVNILATYGVVIKDMGEYTLLDLVGFLYDGLAYGNWKK